VVTAIYPKAEIQDNVVNYVTILKITDRQDKILRPEMTTTVSIFLERKIQVLTLPNNAIQREEGQKFVYVTRSGLIEKQPVKVGWKDKRFTEIVEGLGEGEEVVIGDVDQIEDRFASQQKRRQDDSTAQRQ
jgi:macrolide-specific efflux system membrane fusion protein